MVMMMMMMMIDWMIEDCDGGPWLVNGVNNEVFDCAIDDGFDDDDGGGSYDFGDDGKDNIDEDHDDIEIFICFVCGL